jgi:hypothetical protein
VSISADRALRAECRDETNSRGQVEFPEATVDIGGLNIFYREAGREDAPAMLLLHGFPTHN